MTPPLTFRRFAESPKYCALEPSPLIAAIMDASDGIAPTTIGDDVCQRHFGCSLEDLPRSARRTVAVEAGGRGGKTSRLIAPKCLHAAWTGQAPTSCRGEVLSSLLIAPDMKLGRQPFSFVCGYIDGSPILSRAVVERTKESIDLHRPDGKRVRIEVLAASRGGRATRGRTLLFAGMDEACFFFDEATGVVNDVDIYRAVLQRVVPGGQVWIVSTPWLADVGLLETTIGKNLGTHGYALAVRAGTRALNPSWDPTGEIEQDLREQDPDAASREIDGEPMAGGAGVFFDAAAIRNCTDDALRVPMAVPRGTPVHFGGDLGFASDSSALVGAADDDGTIALVTIAELKPAKGAPLKPKVVIDTFAETMRDYASQAFMGDAHYRESAREHLTPHNIRFVDAPPGNAGKAEVYLLARKLIHEGRVRLPNHPRLLSQLRSVVSKPTPGGGLTISIPRRRGQGHGDLVSAAVLAIWQAHRARRTQGGDSFFVRRPNIDHMSLGYGDSPYSALTPGRDLSRLIITSGRH
jgi:hypothetical protein